jgi:type II secretory pathway pseudopilin PulG
MMRFLRKQSGFILPGVLAFIIAASIIGAAVLTIIMNNFFVVGNNVQSQQAFNIAEAGINYYLWHMAHNGTDYKDGQSTPATPDATLGYGPYVHTYTDSNAKNAGTFTLWIKPQGNGSTIATVRSIGQAVNSTITRTIDARIGAASFASYGLVADTEFWFGSNESANGPVFSNVGVHMDGPNSDVVGSANATYVPQGQYGGDGASHPGVWCKSTVTSPNCNTRDKSNWLYPKTSVDFNQVSGSLCAMKKTAFGDYASTSSLLSQASPCSQTPTTRTNAYIPQYASNGSFSSTNGYLIQLNNNGTYDLYKVSAENDKAASYTTALTKTSVATGIALPPSGVIFVEDNVWVRSSPTFHGRVSIASGRLATSSSTDITIADQLLYSAKDGSDALGLIAEKNVLVAPYAPPNSGSFNFEIDAAALAQSGSVTWPRYYDGTTTCTRGWTNATQIFTFYGSVATRQDWTWNYTTGACGDAVKDSSSGSYYSGVEHTNTAYDYNLLYAPPPSYPVTGSYDILNWREVLTKP